MTSAVVLPATDRGQLGKDRVARRDVVLRPDSTNRILDLGERDPTSASSTVRASPPPPSSSVTTSELRDLRRAAVHPRRCSARTLGIPDLRE